MIPTTCKLSIAIVTALAQAIARETVTLLMVPEWMKPIHSGKVYHYRGILRDRYGLPV